MQIKKYPHKNLNKNRLIYFQIGLSLILIILLISVEWKSYTNLPEKQPLNYNQVVFEEMIEIKLPEKTPEVKTEVNPKEIILPHEPNEKEISEKKKAVVETPTIDFDPNSVFSELKQPIDEPIEEVSWITVEDVPIFPGCEVYKDNNKRRSCMQKRLADFIGKHFNTRLASDLGLEGRHIIYTKFKISHTGEVIFLGGRNPNPELVKEAKRVINKLPEMIPGKQRDIPVNVIFGLPINFKVQ